MAYSRDTGTGHDITTDAGFRAWVTGVHNVLSAIGLVNTSDTGQINLATVTTPASNNTYGGYEIWRFSDAAQSTDPIFIKIEYGRGGSASSAILRMTVGTGSDGAGTLTGASSTMSGSTNNTAGSGLIYGCFSDGAFILIESGNFASTNDLFIVERMRDSSGNLISGRAIFAGSAAGSHAAYRRSGGSWSTLASSTFLATPPTAADTEGRKRLGVLIPEGDNPFIAFGFAKSTEVGSGDTGTMRICGTDRTYRCENFSSTPSPWSPYTVAGGSIGYRPLLLQQ